MYVHALGWNSYFQEQWDSLDRSHLRPARVAEEQRGAYHVALEDGEWTAEVTGRFRHGAPDRSSFPSVGDWVAVETVAGERKAFIQALLPRRTRLSRKIAGERSEEQILVANVDTVFIVTSLNADLNPRRLERYLTMVFESGAQPVILLNKADLCSDANAAAVSISALAMTADVHVVSALTGTGLGALNAYVARGATAVLVGSSGVGKSTIMNAMLQSGAQKTAPIRDGDDRGRHATTFRRLYLMPAGGVLIDTPGLRELQLWDADHVDEAFEDITTLAGGCRFRDCRHDGEPGCAVQEAIAIGALDEGRLESLKKLQRELDHLDRRRDVAAQAEQRRRWKQIAKGLRQRPRGKP
ncbi:MAG TPA: ribosome small subunit-dependent GTPase A [Terriglobia bacterium]|nr:ribosome small subunit-dependent GTPase A [Terriglobia bacterium]